MNDKALRLSVYIAEVGAIRGGSSAAATQQLIDAEPLRSSSIIQYAWLVGPVFYHTKVEYVFHQTRYQLSNA